jgi:hypothetical protein
MINLGKVFLGLSVITILLGTGLAFASPYTFTSVEYPDPLSRGNIPRGINNSGQIVGYSNSPNGFLATPNVPLPSTMLLPGSGLLGLAGWRRFRKG